MLISVVDALLRSFRAPLSQAGYLSLSMMHGWSESQSQHNLTTFMWLFNSLWWRFWLLVVSLSETALQSLYSRRNAPWSLERIYFERATTSEDRVMTVWPTLKLGHLTEWQMCLKGLPPSAVQPKIVRYVGGLLLLIHQLSIYRIWPMRSQFQTVTVYFSFCMGLRKSLIYILC